MLRTRKIPPVKASIGLRGSIANARRPMECRGQIRVRVAFLCSHGPSYLCLLFRPIAIGLLGEAGVEVALVSGDLDAKPGGMREGLVDSVQFDFGDEKALVFAEEFIDLPAMTFKVDGIPVLIDNMAIAEVVEHVSGFGERDFVLEFVAGDFEGGLFDIQDRVRAANPDPNGDGGSEGEVSLPIMDRRGIFTPIVANHQKFSLYFQTHLSFPV